MEIHRIFFNVMVLNHNKYIFKPQINDLYKSPKHNFM